MSTNQKKLTSKGTKNKQGDRVEVRFIPLPPEKRPAWDRSMRLLTDLLLEIVHENPKDDRLRDVM